MSAFIELNNSVANKHRVILANKLKAAAAFSEDNLKLRSTNKLDRTRRIYAIGISFKKHGIYVEKGVGKGRGISSGRAKPKPWYNPVINQYVPIIADDLELNIANLVQKALIK